MYFLKKLEKSTDYSALLPKHAHTNELYKVYLAHLGFWFKIIKTPKATGKLELLN